MDEASCGCPIARGPGPAPAKSSSMRPGGWSCYSRKQTLIDKAVLPVTFYALDGEASWRDETRVALGRHQLGNSHPDETTRPALSLRRAPASLKRCCARRSSRSATCAHAGGSSEVFRPPQRREVWASCWWWRRIRQQRAGILRSSGAGCLPLKPDSGADRHGGRARRKRYLGGVPAATIVIDPGHGGSGLQGARCAGGWQSSPP